MPTSRATSSGAGVVPAAEVESLTRRRPGGRRLRFRARATCPQNRQEREHQDHIYTFARRRSDDRDQVQDRGTSTFPVIQYSSGFRVQDSLFSRRGTM